jgi:hypothetical protein
MAATAASLLRLQLLDQVFTMQAVAAVGLIMQMLPPEPLVVLVVEPLQLLRKVAVGMVGDLDHHILPLSLELQTQVAVVAVL